MSGTINSEEWQAELDRVTAVLPLVPIVTDRGFTAADLSERWGVCISTTKFRMRQLKTKGVIRAIGRRPGQNGEKVYEMVKTAKIGPVG